MCIRDRCTFHNAVRNRNCAMCNAAKPSAEQLRAAAAAAAAAPAASAQSTKFIDRGTPPGRKQQQQQQQSRYTGGGTVFCVHTRTGRRLGPFVSQGALSGTNRDEVILLPGTTFRVKGIFQCDKIALGQPNIRYTAYQVTDA